MRQAWWLVALLAAGCGSFTFSLNVHREINIDATVIKCDNPDDASTCHKIEVGPKSKASPESP